MRITVRAASLPIVAFLAFAGCTSSPELSLPADGVPLNEYFAFDIDVPGDAPDGVEVDADMPSHGHGMLSRPVVTARGGGIFHVEGMLLHMPGAWEIYVTVTRGDERIRTVYPLELQPY